MLRVVLAALAAGALSACTTAPTTAAKPDTFWTVHHGTYNKAEQPEFMDCVFDGFLGAQNTAIATHVRQTKRAFGYRVDVIAQAFQYIVADIHDDGTYELRRSKYSDMLPFSKEVDASAACLKKFAGS